jgi:peptidyl-prolyl cis-trans isomerase SurA
MFTRAHIPADCIRTIGVRGVRCGIWFAALAVVLCFVQSMHGQEAKAASAAGTDAGRPQMLDRVVAVVNDQVILASDIDLEMRIFHLLPIGDRGDSTPPKALERLTTRLLIEQQIVQEDPHGLEIAPAELAAGLTELRQSLPACKRRDCTTLAGWSAYLATLGLTPARVADYWSHRMAVLRFIEQRFRSGVRIAPEEIQKYYRETLVPRYASPQDAPPLERISPRIQEILLQQQVNVLLNDWLKSLQDQGHVEILDPALAVPKNSTPAENSPASAPVPGPVSGPGKGGLL